MSRLSKRLTRSIRRRLQSPAGYQAWKEARARKLWNKSDGVQSPPHDFKASVVRSHARQFGKRVLVETGTYRGDMIRAVRGEFDAVHSIELGQDLYDAAVRRFEGDDEVTIHQGDSGEILAAVLEHVDETCLFWLDGHYSGGVTACGTESTPILRELEAIRAHPAIDHVILIDDARCFTGAEGYPTMDELRDRVEALWPSFRFNVVDDIIRIHRPKSSK